VISMVYRGDGARGLLDYLSSKDGAVLLSTNLDGVSPLRFAKQIGEVRQLYPRDHVAKPVAHIPFRPAPGEDLTDDQWQEVVELTLDRLGYSNSPFIAYLHDHGDGRHLHIATYRVTFEGRLVSDSNDRWKVMQISRELEERYGLTVATPQKPNPLTRAELERQLRDPDRGESRQSLRNALDLAASKHDTLRGFLTELYQIGVSANLKVAKTTGALQGITFTLPDGSTIKGSDLGKKYSLAGICSRHELRVDLRPEGAYLIAGEVTDREYRSLVREGLGADVVQRYGSRQSLYWQLPPGDEASFADLIALRLPHRFLRATDELPARPSTAPDLTDRARKVHLLLELAKQGPSIAPSLVILDEAAAPSEPSRSLTLGERAERCLNLSEALLRSAENLPVKAADLRAEYHSAMLAALSIPRDSFNSDSAGDNRREAEAFRAGAIPHPQNRVQRDEEQEVAPGQLSSKPPGAVLTGAIPHLRNRDQAEEAKVAPGQLSGEPPAGESRPRHSHASLLAQLEDAAREMKEATEFPAFRAAADRYNRLEAEAVLAGAIPAPDSPDPTLAEKTLVAAAAYEQSGDTVAFYQWARLQQSIRGAQRFSRPPATGGYEALKTAVAKLGEDLLEAQDRFTADPSDSNRATFHRSQRAYERLARRLDATSNRAAVVEDLPELRTSLLDAQDRYLTDPTTATEKAWRQARAQYEKAAAFQLPPQPSSDPVEEARQLRSSLALLRRRLEVSERGLINFPTNAAARAAWTEALALVESTQARLEQADEAAVEHLGKNHRQSASTLRFYEESYFRAPSPVSERLWRQAERAHLRASLAYERARLRAEASSGLRDSVREPHASWQPGSKRRRETSEASNHLVRIVEKELLGLPSQAHQLASRAALQAWAKTQLGRTLLTAAHPVRAAISAIPGGTAAKETFDAATEVARRSLLIYAELRAARDLALSARAPRQLENGDFSNRSLATAVVSGRVPLNVQTPSSLPDAIRESRSAEARLHRTYRNFRSGITSQPELVQAAGRALAARAAVTESLHTALGLPSFRDFTAVLSTKQGRSTAAWMGTLQRAGLSARAIASGIAEVAPLAFASGAAAFATVTARQLVRWTAKYFKSQAKEILREQSEGRR
jgi:hypothetical protein